MTSRCLPIVLFVALALFMGLVMMIGLLLRPREGDRTIPLRSRIVEAPSSESPSIGSAGIPPIFIEPIGASRRSAYTVQIEDASVSLDVSGVRGRILDRLTIANRGDSRAEDIRIWEADRDWSSAEAILETITRSRKPVGQRETALAIFDYVHDHLDRDAYRSRWDCFDVWKAFNCYGMGHCEVHSRVLSALWESAGLASLQVNVHLKPEADLFDHTLAEVFYDGGWRLFDSHGSNFFLGADNRTILGWRELQEHPELIAKSRPTGEVYRNYDHTKWMNPELATWSFDKKIARNKPLPGAPDPSLSLRPGESIVYQRDGGATYVDNIREHGPPRVPHSRARFHSVLPAERTLWQGTDSLEGFESTEEGRLVLERGRIGSLRHEVRVCYPIVSATAAVEVGGGGEGGAVVFKAVPLGHPTRESEALGSIHEAGVRRLVVDLGSRFQGWNDPFVRYGYALILEATAPVSGDVWIQSLEVQTDCQVATRSLPDLSNTSWILSASSASVAELEVGVESRDFPAGLLPPENLKASKIVSGTESWIEVEWAPSPGGGLPEDGWWEVDLSDDPGFRWTLLPYLTHREDRREGGFRIPLDHFPTRTRFYIRVCMARSDGLRSAWSETLEFLPRPLR